MTTTNIAEFAQKYRMPGFYMDVCGMYCLCLGRYLISAFNNTDGGALEVCVDELSQSGVFEDNLEWETPNDEYDVVATIRRFLAKYGRKGK